MPTDYLLGMTEAELVAELQLAQRELLSGQSVVSTGAGGASSSAQVQAAITERIRLILAKLTKLNPTDYPASSTRPDTITKVVFS